MRSGYTDYIQLTCYQPSSPVGLYSFIGIFHASDELIYANHRTFPFSRSFAIARFLFIVILVYHISVGYHDNVEFRE